MATDISVRSTIGKLASPEVQPMHRPKRFFVKTCQFLLIVATPIVGFPLFMESAVAQDVVPDDAAEADRLFREGSRLFDAATAVSERLFELELQLFQSDSMEMDRFLLPMQESARLRQREDYDGAIEKFQAALIIFEGIGDRANQANTLNQLGKTYLSLREHEQAIETFQDALTIFEETGDRANQTDTLNQLGNAYLSLGEHEQALGLYQQAIEIRQGNNLTAEFPLTNANSVSPAINPQSQRIVFQNPHILSMRGRRIPGGTRTSIFHDSGLVALVPSNDGVTISPYPKLFIYLPRHHYSSDLEITLFVSDGEGHRRYESTRVYPDMAGILEINMDLVDGLAPLEIGKQYVWRLYFGYDGYFESTDEIWGAIDRVDIPEDFPRDIPLNNLAHAYAAEGLWFDALAVLFDQIGHNPNAVADLRTLLIQENLDFVDTNHFIGSWDDLRLPERMLDESS